MIDLKIANNVERLYYSMILYSTLCKPPQYGRVFTVLVFKKRLIT